MNKNVRTVLSPLLIINYVFGLRIFKFSINQQKPWFGFFYMLLLWSIYFLTIYSMKMNYIYNYPKIYIIYNGIAAFTTLLSIVFGVYHDKKFRNCLKKLTTVETTLEKLGIITNYQQLYKRTVWIVLGFTIEILLLNIVQIIYLKKEFKYNTITALYIPLLSNHCSNVSIIGDLTMTNIIKYVGTKFDQINEHLQNMTNNNKHTIKRASKNAALHLSQHRFAKTPSNKWMIWIIIQLHLELRKISRELDSIYGAEMSFKMGCYFILMATNVNDIFHLIFIHNFTQHQKLYITSVLSVFFHNLYKFLIINLVCEKVTDQANSSQSFLKKVLYSVNDVEICENISQLLLHMKQSSLKFYGIGLFQFGYKFIYRFVASVGTVFVLIIQAHMQSETILKSI